MQNCIATLSELRDRKRLILDSQNWILAEYLRHLSPSGQPGPGDAFFKWLWDNQLNPEHCRQVEITPVGGESDGTFAEFPDDPELAKFDLSDRKFVAVAIASEERPPILPLPGVDEKALRLLPDQGAQAPAPFCSS